MIRLGFRISQDPQTYASEFVGNDLTCGNCHLNAGQRDRALPLLGVAATFPQYRRRDDRLVSLEDRIGGCFKRSMNGTAPAARPRGHHRARRVHHVARLGLRGRRAPRDGSGATTSPEEARIPIEERRPEPAGSSSTRSTARRATPRTARGSTSASRSPDRSGETGRGTTARGRPGCGGWPDTSATRCPSRRRACSPTRSPSSSRRTSTRTTVRRTATRCPTSRAAGVRRMRCTTPSSSRCTRSRRSSRSSRAES